MSREVQLISSAMRDRDAYNELLKYTEDSDFSPLGRMAMKEISKYYNKDPVVKHADKSIILRRLTARAHNDDQAKIIEQIFDSDGTESIPNVLHELLEFKRSAISSQLAEAIMTNNVIKQRELIEKFQHYDAGLMEPEYHGVRKFEGMTLEELTNESMTKAEFPLMPKGLNDRLDGGAFRQAHVGIFARPEVGKSLFTINMACGLLRREHKCLYVGNEDASKRMRMRFLCNLTGRTKFEVMDNPEIALELATQKGLQNLIFMESEGGSIGEIGEWVHDNKPDVLFIDQLRNLTDGAAEGLTTVLETAARGARRIAKRNDILVVSVTQAGESGAGKAKLEPEDVEYSKTGFFAALDLLIGIGANKQMMDGNFRMVSISKNKINNRREYFTVEVDPERSKVKSVD